MQEVIATKQSKFSRPASRDTFAEFRIEAVKTRYSISIKASVKGKQEAAEVLISNFER